MDVIGLVFVWIGVIFCIIGVLGMWRYPDVFIRLHAAGLVTTVGIGGLLIGGSLIMNSIALKAIILLLFLLVTAPTATHAIAQVANNRRQKRIAPPSMEDPAEESAAG